MTDDDAVMIEVDGLVREKDGAELDFSLRVGIPFFDPDRGCGCEVTCPYLRKKPFLIFGVDPHQAATLSVEFIGRLLEGRAELLTRDRGPMALPTVSWEEVIAKRPAVLSETEDFQWTRMELAHKQQLRELLDHNLRAFQTLTDSGLRREIYTEINGLFTALRDHEEGLRWAERCVEEFPDDCWAWRQFSGHFSPNLRDGQESEADVEQAIQHMETAVQKAKEADEWVRECDLAFCRLLSREKDYARLEAVMRDLLDDHRHRRKEDTVYMDDKWARNLPPDRVNPELTAQFAQLRAATKAYLHAEASNPDGCHAPNWEDLKPYLTRNDNGTRG